MVVIAQDQINSSRSSEAILSVTERLGGIEARQIAQQALSILKTSEMEYVFVPSKASGYAAPEFIKLAFNLLAETGEAVSWVNQQIQDKVPFANLALEAVSFASGPVTWAAGKIIMASPLGRVVEDNVGSAAQWLAGKISAAGLNPGRVAMAASGAVFLGGLVFGTSRALGFFRDARAALSLRSAAERTAVNLTERGTLTNLFPDDAVLLQSRARTLVQDDAGRYWLQSGGKRITPSGSYDFVTMPDGTIRVARTNSSSEFSTHLGLSGGDEVSYAGTIRFANRNTATRGTIRSWSNDSGHYQPPAWLGGNSNLPPDLFLPR